MGYNTYVPPFVGSNYDQNKVLIVGRDPGEKEVEQGEPFVGKSGKLLTGGFIPGRENVQPVLNLAGLRREDVALINRVPHRPWNNNFYKHSQKNIDEGLQELRDTIDELEPEIIMTLGNEASYDVAPGWKEASGSGDHIKSASGIIDTRGFFWTGETHDGWEAPCPVITSLHPASCLYQPVPQQMLLEGDMRRLGKYRRGRLPIQEFPDDINIVRTKGDIEELYSQDLVAFDIEVKWGGDALLCIAFVGEDSDMYVAFADRLKAVEDLLRDPEVKLLAHNGSFDTGYLEYVVGTEINGFTDDTMVLHWAMYPELAGDTDTGGENLSSSGGLTRKGLAFLASWHINVPWWKEYTSDPHRMAELCARDVFVTREVFDIMWDDAQDMDVIEQYRRAVNMTDALNAMQYRGIKIDEELRTERRDELDARFEDLYAKARENAEKYLKIHEITHKPDGSEYWWYHDGQCPCCNGGSKKSSHCPECAGVEASGSGGSYLKSDYATYAQEELDYSEEEISNANKEDLRKLLPECSECGGEGKVPEWDFNPMSQTQLPELFFKYLNVPQYTYSGESPDATEDTMKKVKEWSEGGVDRGLD